MMSRLPDDNLKSFLHILTLKICNQRYLENGFKLGQLIQDDEKITWWKCLIVFKKNVFLLY